MKHGNQFFCIRMAELCIKEENKQTDHFMHQEEITYKIGSDSFKGFLALPDPDQARDGEAVLIAHAWMGLDDFAKEKARALAALGYVAFAADLYGNGKEVTTPEEAGALMMPLFKDRALLRQRVQAGFNTLAAQNGVKIDKIGAIGFCFGGMTVIELLRSGTPVKGVVSFHGILGNSVHGVEAKLEPLAKNIKGSLLILNGHEDPLNSQQDIQNIEREMTEAGIDWQINIYGQTSHAFTNPLVDNPKVGLVFNPKSNTRSWYAMRYFFAEILT
jgi:dienelactone hydrolase